MTDTTAVTKGLLVKAPWASLILDGTKTWELRGSSTKHRGPTGIITSTTGQVQGQAELVDVIGPLSREQLMSGMEFHCVRADWDTIELPYAKVFAWVFANAERYQTPKPYTHKMGAVIWVKLD